MRRSKETLRETQAGWRCTERQLGRPPVTSLLSKELTIFSCWMFCIPCAGNTDTHRHTQTHTHTHRHTHTHTHTKGLLFNQTENKHLKHQEKIATTFSSLTLLSELESRLLTTKPKLKPTQVFRSHNHIPLLKGRQTILLKAKYLNFSRQVSTSLSSGSMKVCQPT